jgi:SAM-dependent methyltransferase
VSEPAKGDHFSTISKAYAAFRPRYPEALFDFVASLPAHRHRAWDCGAGSGQATIDLAARFDEVIGTDLSAEQINRAPDNPKIRWLVAPAESTPIEDASVDLITVAQALHWFDHPRFYAEVRRVATKGAAIAAWTYAAPRMEGDVGASLSRYQYQTVGPYWPAERKFVDDEYRSIPFPFERIATPPLAIEQSWTLAQVAGYMRTWSATTRYVARHGVDPVIAEERELAELWGDAESTRRIVWPLIVLAAHLDVAR